MPEIAPAVPATPQLSVAPAAQAPAASAPVADAAAPDFVGQLKAALKTLAGVVAAQATPAQQPSTPAPPAAADPLTATTTPPTDSKTAAKSTDAALPEILAALGLIPLPQTPATPAPQATVDKAQTPVGSASMVAPGLVATQLASAPTQLASPAAPPPPSASTTPLMQPAVETPLSAQPAVDLHLPKEAHVAAQVETPITTAPTPPQPVEVALPLSNAPVAPQDVRASQQPPVGSAPAIVNPGVTTSIHVQPQMSGGAFDQGQNPADAGKQHSNSAAVTDVAESSSAPSVSALDQTMANATAVASAAPSSQPLPTIQMHPGDVVSQIAHQADLYRLPGNKGVRINLHPDDLGGVQVTLRYATGGSLELHINVEHANTGALVQAGWTQLRDALATQGIGPERLVMSITGPGSSSQLDFSSNSGSWSRSDPGLAASTQGGDSGQQRQDPGTEGGATRGTRGWSTSSDATVSDDPASPASVRSASRIDYRV